MKGKYMMVGILVIGGLLMTMNVTVAGEVAVTIDKAEELDCGEQQMDFGGTVDLHEGHRLIVELDDSGIAATVDENEKSWGTGLHAVGVGDHKLYVRVTNSGCGENRVDDLQEFTIEECPRPTPSEEPRDEGSNDPGDEQDCETSTNVDACGEGYTNEEPETPAPVAPQVKGVKKATPTPTPVVEQKLEKLPEAGPDVLLPLMLAGSWLTVAVVGFRKRW